MLRENETVLGLDIEAEGIRLLEIRKAREGIELVRAEILPLPSSSLKNGIINDPGAIAAVIKEFIQANNITSRKVVGLVNSSLALLRLLRLPFVAETEMKAMLEKEADHYVDFKHKGKIIDFCLLEEINEEGVKKVNVIFAAALKEVVNVFTKIAEELHLELIGIDVSTVAVIRALSKPDTKTSFFEPTILVIINKADIQLCILKNNRLRFLHTVLDIKEFINNKAEFVNRLVFSLKLALNYYSRSIHGQEDIRRIALSINDISAKDIVQELSSQLEGFSIEIANPLGRLRIDKAVLSEKAKEDLVFSFAQIIGAVLRVEDPIDYPLSLNLVPLEKQQKSVFNKELGLYASALSMVLFTFLILGSLFWAGNFMKQTKIAALNQKLNEITPAINKLINEYSQNIDLNKKMAESVRIKSDIDKNKSGFSSTLLAKAMVSVSEGLWLKDIATQPKEESLILSGQALDEKAVFEYANNLKNIGYFSKVEPIFSNNQEGTVSFTIKCQLEK